MNTSKISRAIRVNHAGEYGAVRIYEGQLAILGKSDVAGSLLHMRAQEVEHLVCFTRELQHRAVRPTVFLPFWHIGGYAMGALTALISKEAAMACTVAVEDTVEAHYRGQLRWLPDTEPALRADVARIRDEELEHRAQALADGARSTPGYGLLYGLVRGACQLSIWLSERV